MRSFLFVVASTREGGNSELLARHAARSLPDTDHRNWLRLAEHALPPFADTRHSTGYVHPVGVARSVCYATRDATDLVIVTPVYWYSLPWTLAHYLAHWSAWMRIPEIGFKEALAGKRLHAIVVDSDEEGEGAAAPVVDALRRTAAYMGMEWRGALVGHANRPGEIERDAAALEAARSYLTP